MEDIKTIEIENLAKQKKEAKKRFKVIEKYMKEELAETRNRIQELEELIREYYQLENKIENILEETLLMEVGIKEINEKYEFKSSKMDDVFSDIYLVKGDYLLEFKTEQKGCSLVINMKKKGGKRWEKRYSSRGESGMILVEIEYTGNYYMSVNSLWGGYEMRLIKQNR